ncbi:MAG: hypothetical protein U0640_02255 [Phycisphaerales bacterium]
MQVRIPPNTAATIHIPHGPNSEVFESATSLRQSHDIIIHDIGSSHTIVKVGSGTYKFTTSPLSKTLPLISERSH